MVSLARTQNPSAKILQIFYIRKRVREKKMNFKRISANCVNFYTFSGGTKRTKMFYSLPFSYLTMGDSWVIHG